MKYKELKVGKSRSIRMGKSETWLKAELVVELPNTGSTLSVEDVQAVIADIDAILDEEERSETKYWMEGKI